jgi:glucosamine 6-phosphate synthetase-like amidotransferase/phosphosugar isomerase protein
MCGIAAILLQPQARSAPVWAELRATVSANLAANAMRGREATGLGVIQCNGAAFVYKVDLEAEAFIETDGYHALLDTLNEETTVILGHTRLPTQGSPRNPHNNHPIEIGPVVGIHNGHIDNDDELFTRWALPRRAQVDSEILFRRLATLSPLDAQYLLKVEESLACLTGEFTFLAVDCRRPTQLLAFKHANPLNVYYHQEWGALIFSSSYLFLRRAFGHAVSRQTLAAAQVLRFDALRLTATDGLPDHSTTRLTSPNSRRLMV